MEAQCERGSCEAANSWRLVRGLYGAVVMRQASRRVRVRWTEEDCAVACGIMAWVLEAICSASPCTGTTAVRACGDWRLEHRDQAGTVAVLWSRDARRTAMR